MVRVNPTFWARSFVSRFVFPLLSYTWSVSVAFLAVLVFAGCSGTPHSPGGGGVTSANFTFYVTGLESINEGPNFYAIAGVVTIDSNGNVTGGEQDYNDAFGFTSPEPAGDKITGGRSPKPPAGSRARSPW